MVYSGIMRPRPQSFEASPAKRQKTSLAAHTGQQDPFAGSEESMPQQATPPVEPFHAFSSTQPPIFAKPTKCPSQSFLISLATALEKVPFLLRKAVSDWGYKIVTAPTIPQVLSTLPDKEQLRLYMNRLMPPALLKQIQTRLREANWWETITSQSISLPKTILMPETGWTCQGVLTINNQIFPLNPDSLKPASLVPVHNFVFEPVPAKRPARIMLHELGHAVDDFLGHVCTRWTNCDSDFLSQSEEFTRAYEKDIQTMTEPHEKEQFAYFLPREDNPGDIGGRARKEAFAEVFARTQQPDDEDPLMDFIFECYFPNVTAFIKEQVLNPWCIQPSRQAGHAPSQKEP
jgi:hypothetical protein